MSEQSDSSRCASVGSEPNEYEKNGDTAGGYAGIERCKLALQEMKEAGACCAMCVHFCHSEPVIAYKHGKGFGYSGECRRYPPQVATRLLQKEGVHWTNPEVDWNHWCGEWKEHDLQLHEISFLGVGDR